MTRVVIRYCPKCKWLLRAAWMAQELLSTFEAELGELALQPGGSGEFTVEADGTRVWCRKEQNGFPDVTELKRRVRDIIAPEKPLGHSEKK
jgi:selenoprotein W-related protein